MPAFFGPLPVSLRFFFANWPKKSHGDGARDFISKLQLIYIQLVINKVNTNVIPTTGNYDCTAV